MREELKFKICDKVWWENYFGGGIGNGEIEEIDNDTGYMSIWQPEFKDCKVLISAKKINGQWFVYRPYNNYQELLHKI